MPTASQQVQHQAYNPGDAFISKSVTIIAGSVIAVTGLLAASNSSNAVSGVSDPTNGVYSLAKDKNNVILGGNVDNAIYYFENAAAGTYTITVSFTGTQVDAALLIIEEITGCKTSGALSGSSNSGESTGSTSNDAVTAGNITATSGDFILASTISHNGSAASHGTGFTDSYNPAAQFATEHIANSSSGTKAGSFTTTDAGAIYESCVVAFLANSGTVYTLTADTGSFTVSGTVAALRIARKIIASAGSFSVTGTAATLKCTRTISTGSGTFTVTGTAAVLRIARRITAASGSYTVTGTAAGLKVGYKLICGSGSFVVTGTDADLMYSQHHRVLTAESGNFLITTPDTPLIYRAIEDTSENATDQHFDNYVRRYANDRDVFGAIEDSITET